MKLIGKILLCLIFAACNRHKNVPLNEIVLQDLSGEEVNIGQLTSNRILVMTFLSPDCPMCINYTKTLSTLYQEFSDNDISFVCVFPGEDYESDTIRNFLQEYQMDFQGLLDPEYRLSKSIDATVTPEVFVFSKNGNIAYSGAIDNWAYTTGKKRPVITEHYLKNALERLLIDSLPDPEKTEPVGCFIEL